MPIKRVASVYKLGLICRAWSPMVKNIAIRDVIAVAKLAQVNGVVLQVAVDPGFGVLANYGIAAEQMSNMVDCQLYRVYVDHSTQVEGEDEVEASALTLLPEVDCEYEIVEINKPANGGGLKVEKDPYSGTKMFKDWCVIPPTLSLDKPAPAWRSNPEPMYSPYL